MSFSMNSTAAKSDLERLLQVIQEMEDYSKEFDKATNNLANSLQDKVADLATNISKTILDATEKVKAVTLELTERVRANVEKIERMEKKAEN